MPSLPDFIAQIKETFGKPDDRLNDPSHSQHHEYLAKGLYYSHARPMTTEDRNDIPSEYRFEGLTIFNIDTGYKQTWDGDDWRNVGFVGQNVLSLENSRETYVPQNTRIERDEKDDNNIFRVVREYDLDAGDVLWKKSELKEEGEGPEYSQRVVEWYEYDGETVYRSKTFNLEYDDDGDLISEKED